MQHSDNYNRDFKIMQERYRKLRAKICGNINEEPVKRIENMKNPAWFLMDETYTPEVTFEVIELCTDFILYFLGEYQYDSSMNSQSMSGQPRNIQSEIK